jgi:hypothetical protein
MRGWGVSRRKDENRRAVKNKFLKEEARLRVELVDSGVAGITWGMLKPGEESAMRNSAMENWEDRKLRSREYSKNHRKYWYLEIGPK